MDEQLLFYAEKGYTDQILFLLKLGANVNVLDCKWTPLLKAAFNGHAETVTALLDGGADIHAKNMFGEDVLMAAAMKGYTDIVNVLLVRGSNVAQVNDSGMTALMYASEHGSIETVIALLDGGANIEMKDKKGRTMMDHAAANRDLIEEAVKAWVENKTLETLIDLKSESQRLDF